MRLPAALRVALACLLLTCVACGTSPETRRKEAQSNADKYWELLKAGNPEGAYEQTFSSRYKQQLALETFLKFNEALTRQTGPVMGYDVVHYDADPAKPDVVLTYNVAVANSPEPLMFNVKVGQDGSEWRIDQVEPNFQKRAPQAPPAPPLRPPTKPTETAPPPQKK